MKPAAYRDAPAALCFALAWAGMYPARASRQGFSLLWCLTDRGAREWGAPYGPGLLTLGLDPASVLIVKARNGLDAAWALEEGLKAQVFTAALGQIDLKAPLMARRLGLAAQAGRTPCLLLSSHQGGGLPGSLTRWRIEAAPSRKAQFDAASPGPPSWRLTLERCRGEAPGRTWIVEYGDDAYGIGLSAELADRAAQSGEEQRALSG